MLHLASATSFLLQNFAFLAFVAYQAKKQELEVEYSLKKWLHSPGWSQYVAAAGPWHKLLCLLWAGWRGRDTFLSSRHLPPVYQTQIEDPYDRCSQKMEAHKKLYTAYLKPITMLSVMFQTSLKILPFIFLMIYSSINSKALKRHIWNWLRIVFMNCIKKSVHVYMATIWKVDAGAKSSSSEEKTLTFIVFGFHWEYVKWTLKV